MEVADYGDVGVKAGGGGGRSFGGGIGEGIEGSMSPDGVEDEDTIEDGGCASGTGAAQAARASGESGRVSDLW